MQRTYGYNFLYYLATSYFSAVCGDGDLRLVGGDAREEGRLEVCFGERWGTIDGGRWTQTDTEVACRQLGYSTSGKLGFDGGIDL